MNRKQVNMSAGALKKRGSAGLGAITEHKPDIAIGRWTHLIGLDIKWCTEAQKQTCLYIYNIYNIQKM